MQNPIRITSELQKEALRQMASLQLQKSEKKFVATAMFMHLRQFMSEEEVMKVWFSGHIKWNNNAPRLLKLSNDNDE